MGMGYCLKTFKEGKQFYKHTDLQNKLDRATLAETIEAKSEKKIRHVTMGSLFVRLLEDGRDKLKKQKKKQC